jgi:Ca2+-dependent lipid-binding protein
MKTPVVKKTLNPVWSEGNSFALTNADVNLAQLRRVRFQVFDWDRLKSNDYSRLCEYECVVCTCACLFFFA